MIAGRSTCHPIVGMVAFALLVTGACAGGPGGGAAPAPTPISATAALQVADGTAVVVTAGLVAQSTSEVRLCDAMTTSVPPQCVSDALQVDGLDLSEVTGTSTDAGVTWASAVTVRGTMMNRRLTDAAVVRPASTAP
jgi:hypothetical protein